MVCEGMQQMSRDCCWESIHKAYESRSSVCCVPRAAPQLALVAVTFFGDAKLVQGGHVTIGKLANFSFKGCGELAPSA